MTDCEQLQDKSFSLCHSSHFYSVNAKHDLQVLKKKKKTYKSTKTFGQSARSAPEVPEPLLYLPHRRSAGRSSTNISSLTAKHENGFDSYNKSNINLCNLIHHWEEGIWYVPINGYVSWCVSKPPSSFKHHPSVLVSPGSPAPTNCLVTAALTRASSLTSAHCVRRSLPAATTSPNTQRSTAAPGPAGLSEPPCDTLS